MRKEFLLATLFYFLTVAILLIAVYRFLAERHLSELNFFVGGALVLVVAGGWWYILKEHIFAPTKRIEDQLTSLSNDIVHELNIPLSTIQANISLLKRGIKDEKSLKRLARIEAASIRLKRLYDELVYTIHKQIHTVEKEVFDLRFFIEESIESFEEQKRNPFILSLDSLEIEVDKIGFGQMFDNIISNAMKYSPKKSIVNITLNKQILKIEDKGIGMDATEIMFVHERYYQANDEKSGKGLGLALVKAYCDEEGIDIKIISEKKVGTIISLNLLKVSKIHV